MNSTPNIRSLALLGGGDAFVILTAVFAVVMVKANFEPSGKPTQTSQKAKVEKLKAKAEKLKKEKQEQRRKLKAASAKLEQLGIELTGSASGETTSSDGAIYVYVRSGGEIVVEKDGTAQGATEEDLGGTLRRLGGSKVVLLPEPEVSSGRAMDLLDVAKGALPDASTSVGTLKN
jgi:uncharacterized ion transporter superfamily protein YfcC